jgi:hypothetical protein
MSRVPVTDKNGEQLYNEAGTQRRGVSVCSSYREELHVPIVTGRPKLTADSTSLMSRSEDSISVDNGICI